MYKLPRFYCKGEIINQIKGFTDPDVKHFL